LNEAFYPEEEIFESLKDFEDRKENILVPKFGEVTPLFLDQKFTEKSAFPTIQIGKLPERLALIQGGMGSAVSTGEMAGQVAKLEGIGTTTAVMFGMEQGQKNEEIVKKELIHARSIAGENSNNVVGVNIMHALKDYKKLVEIAIKNGAQFLTVGAGLPLDLAKLTKDYPNVALLPIVSGGRATKAILGAWAKTNRKPDAIIYENPLLAGGHEGGKLNEILADSPQYFYRYGLAQVFDTLSKFGQEIGDSSYQDIPVIAAGGINPDDLLYIFNLTNSRGQRVAGVQVATPFLTTDTAGIPYNAVQKDVDANEKFIQIHLENKKIGLIKSTAGLMPGRVLLNDFVNEIQEMEGTVRKRIQGCVDCLKKNYCQFEKTQWCIMQRLLKTIKGETEKGLPFTGRRPQHFGKTTIDEVIQRYKTVFQN